MHEFPRAAVAKHHACVENNISPPARVWRPKVQSPGVGAPCFLGRLEGGTCLAASSSWGFLAIPGVPSVACRFVTLVSWPSAPCMSSPLLPSGRVCLCVQILLFYSETSPIGLGPPHLMTSFNLITSLWPLSPNTATLGVRS